MTGISFILVILFSLIALLSITFVIIRGIRINKNWKIIEPGLRKKVQEYTGQEIVHTMILNANDSTDFSHAKGFLIWFAFTSDYIAFANRNYIADGNDAYIYFSRRIDTSMKEVEKNFMELEFKNKETSEKLKLVVLARSQNVEILSAFIPNKKVS